VESLLSSDSVGKLPVDTAILVVAYGIWRSYLVEATTDGDLSRINMISCNTRSHALGVNNKRRSISAESTQLETVTHQQPSHQQSSQVDHSFFYIRHS
jgi:hypothetical protein